MRDHHPLNFFNFTLYLNASGKIFTPLNKENAALSFLWREKSFSSKLCPADLQHPTSTMPPDIAALMHPSIASLILPLYSLNSLRDTN